MKLLSLLFFQQLRDWVCSWDTVFWVLITQRFSDTFGIFRVSSNKMLLLLLSTATVCIEQKMIAFSGWPAWKLLDLALFWFTAVFLHIQRYLHQEKKDYLPTGRALFPFHDVSLTDYVYVIKTQLLFNFEILHSNIPCLTKASKIPLATENGEALVTRTMFQKQIVAIMLH